VRETPGRGAFAYPRYRRYWLASVAMVFAVQFQFSGSGWLVHRLTDSAFWLGVPGIISAVVTILLTVPAGALADRFDNQRLLVISRGLTGLTHLALAVLVIAGRVELWMVLVWAAVAGALAGLSNPAQSALLPRLIERRAMASAVALISSVWSGMRIIGPALAGILIAVVGIGQAFLVTALGYAISTWLVASLRLEPLRGGSPDDEEAGMFAGVRYVFAHRIFLATIGLSFFSSLFGRSYVVLLPIFSDDILRAGVQGFGYMEAAAGAGALIGTLSIVRVRIGRHTGAMMTGAALVFGLCIAAFAASRSLPLSMLLLFVGAFFSAIYLNLAMTTLQLLVPDRLRGRVMGVWGLTWFLTSAGGFVAASIAEFMGAPFAVALGALSVAGFALFVYVAFADLRAIPEPEDGTEPPRP
jgi:MFS family permease